MSKPVISLLVAAGENGVIGSKGKIPWQGQQKTDSQFFSNKIKGHPIIMGRKTYESKGSPWKDSQNIIVTHDATYKVPGAVVVDNVPDAIKAAGSADEIIVIGGGILFQAALPLADKIYLTRIHTSPPDGDAFFNYDVKAWHEVEVDKRQADESNAYDYDFITLVKNT